MQENTSRRLRHSAAWRRSKLDCEYITVTVPTPTPPLHAAGRHFLAVDSVQSSIYNAQHLLTKPPILSVDLVRRHSGVAKPFKPWLLSTERTTKLTVNEEGRGRFLINPASSKHRATPDTCAGSWPSSLGHAQAFYGSLQPAAQVPKTPTKARLVCNSSSVYGTCALVSYSVFSCTAIQWLLGSPESVAPPPQAHPQP